MSSAAMLCLCSSSVTITPSSSPTLLPSHGFGSKTFNRFPSSAHQLHLKNREAPSSKRGSLMAFKAQKDANQQTAILNPQAKQLSLWALEGVYVSWLFFLPFAPGDPVWAIKSETVRDLLGLSLNFFFILPLANSVGMHVMEAPVLHPMSEGLFNFVIGWTFMFAPLLFTDCRRDRYKGSLDILWGLQMFLTNAFLIPYMAIRVDDSDPESVRKAPSKLSALMTSGAPYVGLIGGAICLVSAWWALFGRGEAGFGEVADRWEFFKSYIGSERLAYAFIWDMGLYTIFQPWLIGDNLPNVQENKVGLVNALRFIPVLGLTGYLLFLDYDKEL